jgi:hypothetical protein
MHQTTSLSVQVSLASRASLGRLEPLASQGLQETLVSPVQPASLGTPASLASQAPLGQADLQEQQVKSRD